jgi:excisionase family DNA binding protein
MPGKSIPRPHSVAAAAVALGISERQVYTEIASGRLRSHKAGRRRFVYPEDIAEYQEKYLGRKPATTFPQ